MRKMQRDLVKGDIIEVEFGDYGHFVTVVVDEVEDSGGVYGCKITCHYLDGRPETMWGNGSEEVEVIEKEE